MKLSDRNHQSFAHAAIDVDPKHRQFNTAIRLTPSTGDAGSTIEVGLNRTILAGSNPLGWSAQIQHLDSELMAKDSRISKKRLIAPESMEIGAANADAVHPNQGLIGLKGRGCRLKVHLSETAGLFQTDCFHEWAEPFDSSAAPTNKSRCSNRPRVKLKLWMGSRTSSSSASRLSSAGSSA